MVSILNRRGESHVDELDLSDEFQYSMVEGQGQKFGTKFISFYKKTHLGTCPIQQTIDLN